MQTGSMCIPNLKYQNAPQAIDWLCEVFGFKQFQVFNNEDGTVAHAQLKLGQGMIMLSSVNSPSELAELMCQPNEINGRETQSVYIVVENADKVHASAIEHGAKIERELRDESYGGRGFTCRDLENRLWSIGTYNPWIQ